MPFPDQEEVIRAARAKVRELVEAVAEGHPRAAVFQRGGRIDFVLLALPDYLVPAVKGWLDGLNGGPPTASGHFSIPTDPERN